MDRGNKQARVMECEGRRRCDDDGAEIMKQRILRTIAVEKAVQNVSGNAQREAVSSNPPAAFNSQPRLIAIAGRSAEVCR